MFLSLKFFEFHHEFLKYQRSCLAIVYNACFNMTCPRKQNSIQNASVLTNFLSGVLNSQTEKLPGDLEDAEYLFMAGCQFREEFLFLQLKYDLLVGGQDRIYSFRHGRYREDAVQYLQSIL
jgi:hypothetical protein